MKKWISVLVTAILIAGCFFPWVYIESENITVTGMDSTGTNFGKPAYFHFFIAAIYLIFHFTPRIWAKRFNLLVAALGLAWAIRNYFIVSACSGGECPVKKPALFVVLLASILMLITAMFPQINLDKANKKA